MTRRPRRATHPGTSAAAREASRRPDVPEPEPEPTKAPRPRSTAPDVEDPQDPHERWLLEQRPPHWG